MAGWPLGQFVQMRYVIKRTCLALAIALAAALLVPGGVTSSYATLAYNEWMGNPSVPLGITATFETVTTGHVMLTMSIPEGIPALIKVKKWGFNYVGVLEDVEYKGGSDGLQAAVFIGYGQHTRAGGGGYSNLYFEFPTSGITLSAGRELVYDLYGTGLEEDSFIFKNAQFADGTSKPAYNGYYSAIHVLTMPPNDLSSWARATTYHSAPIPAAVWLLASGLIALVVIRRRMRKKLPLRNREKVY